MSDDEVRGKAFWIGLAIGWVMIGVGLRGVFTDVGATPPVRLGIWVVGLALLHDLLIAPAVYGVGRVIARFASARWSAPLQVGAAVTAFSVAFVWPYLRGYGRLETNPSVVPLAYGRNLAVLLVIVWIAVAGWGATRTVGVNGDDSGADVDPDDASATNVPS